jgi:hypothetical protein
MGGKAGMEPIVGCGTGYCGAEGWLGIAPRGNGGGSARWGERKEAADGFLLTRVLSATWPPCFKAEDWLASALASCMHDFS